MDLNELLSIIKEEFPDKSIDISESLSLLMDTIDDIMNLINLQIGKALSNRDIETLDKYSKLVKIINQYENRIDEIINIARIEQDKIIEDDNEESQIKSLPNYQDYIVDNRVEHSLYENFTHIRPFGFKINTSELIEVRTWQEMLIRTCEMLIEIDSQKFLNFENLKIMNGKKNKYFSISPEGMRKPEKVANITYIETNMSGNAIRNLIVKILKQYGIKVGNYKVYFRADYSNLNR